MEGDEDKGDMREDEVIEWKEGRETRGVSPESGRGGIGEDEDDDVVDENVEDDVEGKGNEDVVEVRGRDGGS